MESLGEKRSLLCAENHVCIGIVLVCETSERLKSVFREAGYHRHQAGPGVQVWKPGHTTGGKEASWGSEASQRTSLGNLCSLLQVSESRALWSRIKGTRPPSLASLVPNEAPVFSFAKCPHFHSSSLCCVHSTFNMEMGVSFVFIYLKAFLWLWISEKKYGE